MINGEIYPTPHDNPSSSHPSPHPSPLVPTPMEQSMIQSMPDPIMMQKMAQQMGPAGAFMMNSLNMMGQMVMSMQGMASMMTALQMQQQQLKAQQQQRQPNGLTVNVHQHPDMQPPQWNYLSPESKLAPNSPPPYRIQQGGHW